MMDTWLRRLGALLIIGVGVVHLQQYLSFIEDVPTIGTLFVLNSLAAGAICLLLVSPARVVAALGGIALSVGSLVSILISRYAGSGLFDYREISWRGPIIVAVALEVAAVAVLAATLVTRRRV